MLKYFTIYFILCCFGQTVVAQDMQGPIATDSFATHDFSISYDININSTKTKSIAETYNGAVKTVYVKNNRVRLRLVSLMRTQNIFFNYHSTDTSKLAVVTKESGKRKYKYFLSKSDWVLYNAKYQELIPVLSDDSIVVLGKLCRKATLTLKDESTLVAYYVPGTKNAALMAAEPMFSALPGIVLQYEFHQGKKSIIYTAKNIVFAPLSDAYLKAPVKGYTTKKLTPGKTIKEKLDDDDEEDNSDK